MLPASLVDKPSHRDETGTALILVVEDSAVAQAVFRQMVEPLGHQVEFVPDPAAAIAFMDESTMLPDLMLVNLGVGGAELCRAVRTVWAESQLPIIATTTDGDGGEAKEDAMADALALGFNDFVAQPFRRVELCARIATQLRLKETFRLESEAHVLYNLLPRPIIARLAHGETGVADALDNITVLFSDVVGFTELCTRADTGDVVRFLNAMFIAFDGLADRHGVYKVDMIGDAYFCICGHSAETRDSHARRTLALARDMLAALEGMRLPYPPGWKGDTRVRIRIGMHTGPAFAGVIGARAPRYTYFGDTVNVASRMESHGYPMCIHVRAAPHGPVPAPPGSASCAPAQT